MRASLLVSCLPPFALLLHPSTTSPLTSAAWSFPSVSSLAQRKQIRTRFRQKWFLVNIETNYHVDPCRRRPCCPARLPGDWGVQVLLRNGEGISSMFFLYFLGRSDQGYTTGFTWGEDFCRSCSAAPRCSNFSFPSPLLPLLSFPFCAYPRLQFLS